MTGAVLGTRRPSPEADAAGAPRRAVEPSLTALVGAWPDNPAVVHNRAHDVLAANPLADALFHGWTHSRNLLHLVFTDPSARAFYRDWHDVARDAVAGFRLGHGAAPEDPRVRQVLGELLARSSEFAELWSRHDARGKALDRKRFTHRDVGPLTLTMQTFDVRSAPGQELVVHHAESASPSSQALALLAAPAATARREG